MYPQRTQFSKPDISPLFVAPQAILVGTTFTGLRVGNQTCTHRIHRAVGHRVNQRYRLTMITQQDNLGLTPVLRKYVDSFAMVPDPKLRYQQLLYLAKKLPPMEPSLKTEENRVRGCTSVVHVHVSLDDERLVRLQGDSDAQLTKGLLALLMEGLDGAQPEAVVAVDPDFISASGLSVSLTPSRNNGFVNMLAKIKDSVAKLANGEQASVGGQDGQDEQEEGNEIMVDPDRPMYSALVRNLATLKPSELRIEDKSAAHKGHAAVKGLGGESHFAVFVVAEAFESLSLVQRHRMIYALMNDEMKSGDIHALEIRSLTPEEFAAESS